MKKNLALCALTCSLVILLTGCGLGKDNATPPTPLQNFQPTLNLHTSWAENVGKGSNAYYLKLTPAADNNAIFTPSYKGQVTAVNASTGRIQWTTHLKQTITSGLAAGDNQVYVSTTGPEISALSQTNGQVVWTQPLNNETLGAPVYGNHVVVVQTLSGTVAAFDSHDGHRLWRVDESVPSLILHLNGQAQIAGNTVVVGFANGELIAFDLHHGQVRWDQHVALPSGDNPISQMVDVTANPIIVGNTVYAVSYQGKVAAFDLSTGRQKWSQDISSYAGLTATQDQVFVSEADSTVQAFNAHTGISQWRQYHLIGRQITAPAAFGNAIVIADRYGYLHALSQQTGQFIGRVRTGDGALAQPIVYNGTIYIYTEQGNLMAIKP